MTDVYFCSPFFHFFLVFTKAKQPNTANEIVRNSVKRIISILYSYLGYDSDNDDDDN